MTTTLFSTSTENGASWCIQLQPNGITTHGVVSFRRWNRLRSLLNRNARWTGDGWDSAYWIPRPPAVPQWLLNDVEQQLKGNVCGWGEVQS